ncbi:hypothetical protein XA68_14501 [Ophiocordyceps unilateralis]|uniref:Rhodopsin domain-containing protein n=1 Tax=Ophiocordyceps unilateralis TaxID=268505 RepID=A0A2A9PMW7_OPHUN|nr:hypothetical protein XA68_14501 [Ophiocordyceps unilateralis]
MLVSTNGTPRRQLADAERPGSRGSDDRRRSLEAVLDGSQTAERPKGAPEPRHVSAAWLLQGKPTTMENFPSLPPARQQAILNGPGLAPPPGVVPNFVHPPNKTSMGVTIIAICLVLGTLTGLIRLYSRICVKKMHAEDVLGFAAYVSFVASGWSLLAFGHYGGFFVHQWNVQAKTMITISYVLYFFPIFYCATMLFAKTAILLEWTRIFVPVIRNSFYWISRVTTIINVCLYLSVIVATSLYCVPVEKVWHKWVPGHCLNRKAVDTCVAVFNLGIDLLILALPQRIIWSLRIDTSKKIGVSIVFSVGLLACACAIARTYLVIQLDFTGDVTYKLCETFMFAYSEMACVLMVFYVPASARAFKQNSLLSRMVSSLRSWTRLPPSKKNRSAEDVGGQFPPTIGSKPINRVLHSADEETQALSLGEMRPAERFIVKTMEFEQREDAASKASTEPELPNHRQHPWAKP